MPVRITADRAPSWVAARLPASGGTRWIGIDGFGASGKSTLAAAIARAIPGSVVIAIDDFARPGLIGWDRARFAAQVIEPLQQGRAADYQQWDWASDTPARWVRVPAGRPVIVEGVSSTDTRVGLEFDLALWVEASAELRWRRILERDDPALLEVWRTDWIPNEQAYAAAQRPWLRVNALVTAPGDASTEEGPDVDPVRPARPARRSGWPTASSPRRPGRGRDGSSHRCRPGSPGPR